MYLKCIFHNFRMGTKDDDLIFLIVTRAEVDLESVKQEYHRMYHKSLAADVAVRRYLLFHFLFAVNFVQFTHSLFSYFIQGDTSGDYKKILMALLGN